MLSEVLAIKDLTIQFGGLTAVSELTLSIPECSIFGIIGPNGAGKTTVFNMLTGVYVPTSGSIRAFGQALDQKRTFEIAQSGLTRTFQNIRLFKELSVRQNVLVGLDHNPSFGKSSLLQSIFATPRYLKLEQKKKEESERLLALFDLCAQAEISAKNLPYGAQRRLEIARALGSGAKIILLDEPAAGMNSQETEVLMHTVRRLRDECRVTVVLIEHDMEFVMQICERIAVLDYGKKIAEGRAEEIQKNQAVLDAYLGTGNKK